MTPDEMLRLRMQLMFSRGVLRHGDVTRGLAMPQGEFFGKELRRVEMPQGYGFGSSPFPGTDLFAAFANGDRSAGVVLGYDDRQRRPKDLKEGEVIVYGAHALASPWHYIKFTDDPKPGTIKVKARRIEIRGGQYYSLWDDDIGERSGVWPPDQELPIDPG